MVISLLFAKQICRTLYAKTHAVGCFSILHFLLSCNELSKANASSGLLAHFQVWSGGKDMGVSSSTTIMTTFRGGKTERQKGEKGGCGTGQDASADERLMEIPDTLDFLDQQCIRADTRTFVRLLQECINMKALAEGKRVHAYIIKSGIEQDMLLGNNLINMYAKCGSLLDAREVFDRMPKRDVISWTAMIAGCAHHGHSEAALKLFWQIQEEGLKPNGFTFVSVLNACAHAGALAEGKLVHALVVDSGLESNVVVGTALVSMYIKCVSIKDACRVFSNMSKRNVVSWTVMIAGYAQHGYGEEALKLFWRMQTEDLKPNKVTFTSVLNACTSLATIAEGKLVHACIIDSGVESDVTVGSALVSLYSKCASVEKARHIFDHVPNRDVVMWNVMIAGYAHNGCGNEVLKLFQKMKLQGVNLDKFTFSSILSACASLADLAEGKNVHAHIKETGLESDIFVGNALVDMYAKCGSIEDAYKVFSKIPKRDVVSWNAMVAGFTHHGHGEDALKLFWQMKKEGINPNKLTFLSVLHTCADLAVLAEGKLLHAHIMDSGIALDATVGTALVNMYSQCASIHSARYLFDKLPRGNVVLWTVMIAGYAHHGYDQEALKLFWQMQREGAKPNEVTFVSALNACTNVGAVAEGKLVHAHIIGYGMESDVIVGTALVNMYNKCTRIEAAHDVFRKMPKRDAVSWNAMIAGCAQHGLGKEALELFQQMQQEGIKPDQSTFCTVLNACASLEDMAQGKQVHVHIINSGLHSNVFVGNALVDMYAKCGSIKYAHQMFANMSTRDVVSWNALITGYAQQGHGEEALDLFQEMNVEGVQPDQFTFCTVLSVCANLVALAQGKQVHAHIIKTGLESDLCVGNALVDMYAKCGSKDDAYEVFDKMPKRDVVSWNAMIAASAQHGFPKETLELFWQMQQEGLMPNEFTFSSILTACSHSGLIDEGRHYFYSMSQDYGIMPTMGHYAGIVDLLGRAGYLGEAEGIINKMPFQPIVVVWMSLLGACRNHGNVELAEYAARHVIELEPNNSAAYVLLRNIYASFGRWEDQVSVRKLMSERGVKKEPAFSWIEVDNSLSTDNTTNWRRSMPS